MSIGNDSKPNTDYRLGFKQLVSDIDNNLITGIPSYDDNGVIYGDVIEIDKGTGDFVNMPASMDVNKKTFTYYNNLPKGQYWSSSSDQFIFAYSNIMNKSSTRYDTTGVVKLFDRYVWAAVGTYWADMFGLEGDTGYTYRIHLDTGISYDIINFDVKSPSHTINTPSGQSLGQANFDSSGNPLNICLTEFEIIDYKVNYPTWKSNGKTPDMNYSELLIPKKDIDHTSLPLKMGDFNHIPEFKGNIIAIQKIDDPAVKELFEQAREEVKEYR